MYEEFLEDWKLVRENIPAVNMPSRSVLRNIIAPFLRKWVCDNDLRNVDPQLGKSLKVKTFIDTEMINYCKRGHAIYWHLVVPLGVAHVSGAAPIDHVNHPAPEFSRYEKEIIYNQFVRQRVGYRKVEGMMVDKCFVRRDQAIRYFCNNRGGTHTHGQGKKTIEPIDALEKEIGFNFETNGIVNRTTLASLDVHDEGQPVYTFLHSITYDTYIRLGQALENSNYFNA